MKLHMYLSTHITSVILLFSSEFMVISFDPPSVISKSKSNFWFRALGVFELFCFLKSLQMINADNFIFVGPTVPFGGGKILCIVILFLFPCSVCLQMINIKVTREWILLASQIARTLMENTPPPPSANASCHTSLFRVPKTVLRPPQFRLQPLTEPLTDVMIPEWFPFRNLEFSLQGWKLASADQKSVDYVWF